ncbi:hypothetical protein [Jongsikchunia kroppenstedtii]|uniref:hypothetical protein n=1 Tax=Jongsikchunia kroppenstedtii TaxID=1121721 RepID=UPI001C9D88A6|nr:hypothetical protein [Jongsikchunia kroppenstedtii]
MRITTEQSVQPNALGGNQFDIRAAGWAAVLAGLLSVPVVGLYFVYSDAPPASNVLTRGLVTLIFVAALLVFGIAVAGPLKSTGSHVAALSGRIATASLLIYAVVILFATSLEVGTVLEYPDGTLDPTTDGPLAAAMALAHGPIAHIFIAMFLGGFAHAASVPGGERIAGPRVIRGSVVVAILNLAAVPSMYFGMDATHFYAVNGWGADALVGLITMLWIAIVGVGILRTAPRRPVV